MQKNLGIKLGALFFIFSFFLTFFPETEALARVGGGRSSGSRGSRSYSAPRTSPSSPSSQPSQGTQGAQPSQPAPQTVKPPQPPPVQQPQSSIWRGIAGGIVGGLIGGMLFRSLGFAGGTGGFGGGIGLIEILLFAALLLGVFWFIKRRRQEAAAQSYYQAAAEPVETTYPNAGSPYGQAVSADQDLERGIGHIQQMDSSFDEKAFRDQCMDLFFKVQGAWANRDMSGAKNHLTEEMFGLLQGDADKLRAGKKINRLDNIAVRSVDIVEAWQESGQDFITVRFYANLLDYVEDETTGKIVSGSKTDPVKFDEFWTFTRPVGKAAWKLSAIQQVE